MRTFLPAVALLLTFAGTANAAPIFYTFDFIPDGSRTAFNGFESLPDTGSYGATYTFDGIQVDQINGELNDIWTTCSDTFSCTAQEGDRSWYPSGGDSGYTRVTLANGNDFQNLGFLLGNGWNSNNVVYANYQALLNGVDVLVGSVLYEADGNNYLGFGGGGFDEVRITATFGSPDSPSSGAYQALQLDSIETAGEVPPVPEPTSMLLLGTGVIGLIAKEARRRRKQADSLTDRVSTLVSGMDPK